MRFNVNSNILKEGVLSVAKALPVRSTMPVLEGVQLVANENGLLLRCSDLTLQKECLLPAIVEIVSPDFAESLRTGSVLYSYVTQMDFLNVGTLVTGLIGG